MIDFVKVEGLLARDYPGSKYFAKSRDPVMFGKNLYVRVFWKFIIIMKQGPKDVNIAVGKRFFEFSKSDFFAFKSEL